MYPDSNQQLSYTKGNTVYFFVHAFDPLSNWSAHQFTFDNNKFPTVDHAYHFYKFVEDNKDLARAILEAPSPWAAMQIARKNKAKISNGWHKTKVDLMKQLMQAKVEQNIDVKDCLIATGYKKIIENNPWDSFWGAGPDGKGDNHIGKILMQIRDEITDKG